MEKIMDDHPPAIFVRCDPSTFTGFQARCFFLGNFSNPLPRWLGRYFICHQLGGQAVSSTKKVWDVYSHQSLNLRRPGRSRWLFVAKLSRNERIHVVAILQSIFLDKGVSKNGGTPKSLILIGFSIINHPFWGTPIFGNTHIVVALPCSFVNSIVFLCGFHFFVVLHWFLRSQSENKMISKLSRHSSAMLSC